MKSDSQFSTGQLILTPTRYDWWKHSYKESEKNNINECALSSVPPFVCRAKLLNPWINHQLTVCASTLYNGRCGTAVQMLALNQRPHQGAGVIAGAAVKTQPPAAMQQIASNQVSYPLVAIPQFGYFHNSHWIHRSRAWKLCHLQHLPGPQLPMSPGLDVVTMGPPTPGWNVVNSAARSFLPPSCCNVQHVQHVEAAADARLQGQTVQLVRAHGCN